jgi:hypothetical protein
MEPKEKIKLQWQNHIYEVGIEHPWPGQFENTETRAKFAESIDDEPKQIAFYLYESLMESTDPELIHPYLEKLFQIKFSIGSIINKNQVLYFKIHESSDHGATVIIINNNEARMQLERSL